MTHDRNYYSTLTNCELITYTYNHAEADLELVLTERLRALVDVEDQLQEALRDLKDEQDRRDKWQAEANDLRATVKGAAIIVALAGVVLFLLTLLMDD